MTAVDLVSRAVTLDDRYVTLTRREYHPLHLLASHAGLVMTQPMLLKSESGVGYRLECHRIVDR